MHIATSLSPGDPNPAGFIPLQIAGYVLPLCTNVMVTGLIIYAIWNTVQRPAREPNTILPATTHLLWSVTAIIVESGLLYLVFQLVFVVFTALNNPVQEIIAMMAVQIYVSPQ